MYNNINAQKIVPIVTDILEPSLDGVTLPVADPAAELPTEFVADIDPEPEAAVALEAILVLLIDSAELKSIVIVVLPPPEVPPFVPLPRPFGNPPPARKPVIFVNPVSVHNNMRNAISSVQV